MLSIFYRALVLVTFIAVASVASQIVHFGPQLAEQEIDKDSFRFVKVNDAGQRLLPRDGPWQCVYDAKTDLLWMVGRDDESPFDSYWSYSWYSETLDIGVQDQGSCFFIQGGCNTNDLIIKANESALCNSNTWRLPTTNELLTLVQPSLKAGGATIHNMFFPQTKKADYWTQTHSQQITANALMYLKDGAEVVSFKSGKTKVLPYRTAAYVKLVSR